MNVHLVDGPSLEYKQINIDIQRVDIHNGTDGWITLGSPNVVVNLLSLTGGVEEMLVDGKSLPAGHYDQMRLVLGPRNTLTFPDDTTAGLKVPSGMQSGVKLNVSFDVAENTTKDVFIDFDAHRSVFVHEAGKSGQYLLRPVVRAVDKVVTGAITGRVTDTTQPVALPIAGVLVTAQTYENGAPVIVRAVTTNVDGTFVLDLLPVGGTYYAVTQPVAGTTTTTTYGVDVSGPVAITATAPVVPVQDLAVSTITAPGALSGTINPLPGAEDVDEVSVLQPLFPLDPSKLLIVRAVDASSSSGIESYDVPNLPPGSYTVVMTRSSPDGAGGTSVTATRTETVTVESSTATLPATVLNFDLTTP